MNLKILPDCFLFILSLCIFSSNLYGQRKWEVSPYFKIYVANTDPEINEIVSIRAECTAPKYLEDAIILFSICGEGTESEEGMELIEGEKLWRGAMYDGEIISKEIINKI